MRFSVDAHAIGRHLTGNEVYVKNLLHGFAALDNGSQFIAYISEPGAAREIPERFDCRYVAPNPFLRLGYDLTSRLRKDRPDLIHVQYTAPLGCPVPVVVSVHDISFVDHPEFFPLPRVAQLRVTVERTVRRAARVLTPSEFSRREILRTYQVDPEKVKAIPNAVSSEYRPRSREQARALVRERFGISAPFLLTVGDLQPRKNQAGLIRAFEELVSAYPELPHHLVIVGKEGWKGAGVRRRAQRSRAAERIHLTGFVSDEDLKWFYAACEIFVFPSFYEGFGLPILEAMASGRAVACSNATAVPEVADACAILFDPASTREMTLAMRDLLIDAELRSRIERLGVQRAASYSWKNTAKRTLEVYYEIAARTSAAKPVTVKSVPVS